MYVETEDEHWDEIDEITEEEEDMLDMAPYLQENSSLGAESESAMSLRFSDFASKISVMTNLNFWRNF